MSQNYSLHFFLKRPRNYSDGEVPIYMRITVTNGGTPKEASAGRSVNPSDWISSVNRAKGNTESIRTLNTYLDSIERKVESIHTELKKFDEEITSESMMNKYQNKGEKRYFLLEILREHNDKMEALLGIGFKPNTLKGYVTSLKHLTRYINT